MPLVLLYGLRLAYSYELQTPVAECCVMHGVQHSFIWIAGLVVGRIFFPIKGAFELDIQNWWGVCVGGVWTLIGELCEDRALRLKAWLCVKSRL